MENLCFYGKISEKGLCTVAQKEENDYNKEQTGDKNRTKPKESAYEKREKADTLFVCNYSAVSC